eukprot:SM003559S13207  [mRNA]  locus=s3559:397:1377:+ [translate_table: standard]
MHAGRQLLQVIASPVAPAPGPAAQDIGAPAAPGPITVINTAGGTAAAGMHPPGVGHHVVRPGMHPPGVGHHHFVAPWPRHPPGVGHHPPGVGHHAPPTPPPSELRLVGLLSLSCLPPRNAYRLAATHTCHRYRRCTPPCAHRCLRLPLSPSALSCPNEGPQPTWEHAAALGARVDLLVEFAIYTVQCAGCVEFWSQELPEKR